MVEVEARPEDRKGLHHTDTLAGLKSAEGYIRRALAKSINLRNTEIRFVMDQSIEYGVHMSKLIDDVNQGQ